LASELTQISKNATQRGM